MTNKINGNPLYGLKLELLLTEISLHYGWELLSDTLNIDRFQYHTGMKSTAKFLRNNQWAREKVENFYLYQYKALPFPCDKQLSIPPRDRHILCDNIGNTPAQITEESKAQFDNASKLRNYTNVGKSSKECGRTEEPAYDPSDPWRIKEKTINSNHK